MTSRTYFAALFAVLMNVTVFTAGALILFASPYSGSQITAYLLPAGTAISLFISPILGWVAAARFTSGVAGPSSKAALPRKV
jgi:hypothetical protein